MMKARDLFRVAKLAIITDETTDVSGRFALQILFQKLDFTQNQVPWLVDTVFLEAVNNQTVARAVVDCCRKFDINFSNVMIYSTDNVSYMLKSFNDCLHTLFENCTHVTCFAHILALVGETWRDALPDVDKLVASIKAIFARNGLRKKRYLDFLNSRNVEKPSLYPPPVVTRWGTWFLTVKYIYLSIMNI